MIAQKILFRGIFGDSGIRISGDQKLYLLDLEAVRITSHQDESQNFSEFCPSEFCTGRNRDPDGPFSSILPTCHLPGPCIHSLSQIREQGVPKQSTRKKKTFAGRGLSGDPEPAALQR